MADTPSNKRSSESPKAKAAKMDPFLHALEETLTGEDRTVAIIGGSFVENALEKLLRLHFQCSKATIDNLFEKGDHILGTFSAKINICEAMGLIGGITKINLGLIKEIRNKFAHKLVMDDESGGLDKVSFKTKIIAEWCKSLRPFPNQPWPKDWSSRKKFTIVCMTIAAKLFNYLHRTKKPEPPVPVLD